MWLHCIFLKHFLLLKWFCWSGFCWVVLSFFLFHECHQMVLDIVCFQFEYTLAYSFIKLNMANNLIVSIWMSTKQWQIKRSLADLKCQNGSIMYGEYSPKNMFLVCVFQVLLILLILGCVSLVYPYFCYVFCRLLSILFGERKSKLHSTCLCQGR